MKQFILKIIISALIIAGASEIAKRFTPIAAIIASLPFTSILAIIWLFQETGDVKKIAGFASNIFWAVLPSLFFFALFPLLLKSGFKFGSALAISCAAMIIVYAVYLAAMGRFGVKI